MGRKYTDNALTTLAGAITAVSTTLTVAAGKGNNFPAITGKGAPGATPDHFVITMEDAAGNREKMRVEHRPLASDVLGSAGFPLVRGVDGTVARAWNPGDSVDLRHERSAGQGWEDDGAANSVGRAFGYKDSTTVGLNLGYYGGLVYSGGAPTTIADGTTALTANQTNFVERTLAGVVSANTAAFTAGRVPLRQVVTDGTGITSITEKRATLMQDKDGGLTVATISATTLSISGAGPHAIGSATDADSKVAIGGTWAGTTSAYGLNIFPTITVPANGTGGICNISGTLNKAGSGTHADFAALVVNAPSIGAGAAALTNATTLKLAGAPSVGTNQRALWVTGGLVSFDGGQIQFPATQSASSDANTLDDYEKGTFSATPGGTSTSNQTVGNYTKIGRVVLINGRHVVNAIGTGSTTTLSTLPFAARSDSIVAQPISVSSTSGLATAVVSIGAHVNDGNNSIAFTTRIAASTGESGSAVFANGTSVHYGGMYHAAS